MCSADCKHGVIGFKLRLALINYKLASALVISNHLGCFVFKVAFDGFFSLKKLVRPTLVIGIAAGITGSLLLVLPG